MKKISIIIPVYNEEKVIMDCLKSISQQTYKHSEIIVVNDGSIDKTKDILREFKKQNKSVRLLSQNHKGPGSARNLGALESTGEILVFVDADMTFEKNFIKNLTDPIIKGKAIGTFSKEEFVSNSQNIWSFCWNINRHLPPDRMLPKNFPDTAFVFRAILKKDFQMVGGFETTGQYIDDWSLSQKLGKKSVNAPGAIYFHMNPSTLKEVWQQARWIGKNDFISGTPLRKIKSVIIYNPFMSLVLGLYKSLIFKKPYFLIFKLIYDLAVTTSVVNLILKEEKYK